MAVDFCPLKDQPGSTSAMGENPGDESLESASQWSYAMWGALNLPLNKADLPLGSGTTPRGQRCLGVVFPPTKHLTMAVSSLRIREGDWGATGPECIWPLAL